MLPCVELLSLSNVGVSVENGVARDGVLCFCVAVQRETFKKIQKKFSTFPKGGIHSSLEMSSRSLDKDHLNIWIQRGLMKKLNKLAKDRGESLTDVVAWILTKAVANVELTSDDYREIAEETKKAEQLRAAKRVPRS
jgi:hypothetical protein